MMICTEQMSIVHEFEDQFIQISANGKVLESPLTSSLCGSEDNLKWTYHVTTMTISSCSAAQAINNQEHSAQSFLKEAIV